jgi:hypothetical protein
MPYTALGVVSLICLVFLPFLLITRKRKGDHDKQFLLIQHTSATHM